MAKERKSVKKSTRLKSKAQRPWAKKIAANRGDKWHKNMLEGRRQAHLNPSNIRLLRMERHWDQAHLAKSVNISESTFGAIERGRRPVKIIVAKAIASRLKVPVTKIFQPMGKTKKKYVAVIQKLNI